ncbi:HAMP domain-containing histidine kinase [Kovacikia minuta CCNUW1]|uniref:sensor histidine kinase n=1 Tax=Kovacikia minuta TaxID=2931930 RepID=UPI001CCDAA8A|nr:HAMP domain-containing sensor histidine kinase [Kovacikia minuta]UBF24755.1 HAMP domain-containing histidine kinase [Kovacikia minuta CCNUW1]
MEPNLNDSMDAELMQALYENHALQEQIAMQTQFMHLLTHQLATPLTSLNGSVHLLAEPSLGMEQRQEFLTLVQQQIHRLEHLLQDLVAIRNLETGILETHPVLFPLPALVEEVVEAFRPYSITYQFSPDLPEVWSDRWQVSQVLVNLLSNAIKYSPNGSPIEIGAMPLSAGWVQAWVKDSGLGIPAADQSRLFERFYRVKHSDRQNIEGTGLGLSLCKLLIENQAGQLWFESVHNQGSCFYFTLPTVSRGNQL